MAAEEDDGIPRLPVEEEEWPSSECLSAASSATGQHSAGILSTHGRLQRHNPPMHAGVDSRPGTCRNCSADSAPRVPLLKLSMKRTQLRSIGTVVPPLVTTTIGRAGASVVAPAAEAVWRSRNCRTRSVTSAELGEGSGASSRKRAALKALIGACPDGADALGLADTLASGSMT